MDHLSQLENKSIYIIREAYYQFKDIAMLWSIGKDSTTLLWLCRKAFFGKIPFSHHPHRHGLQVSGDVPVQGGTGKGVGPQSSRRKK